MKLTKKIIKLMGENIKGNSLKNIMKAVNKIKDIKKLQTNGNKTNTFMYARGANIC